MPNLSPPDLSTTRASGRTGRSHRWLIVSCLWLSLNSPVIAGTPGDHDFQIAPQTLAAALVEFSKQADVQVLGATEAIGTLHTAGVSGHLTGEQALERLLRGTELSFRWTGQHTVTIAPRAQLQPAATSTNSGSIDPPIRMAQENTASNQILDNTTVPESKSQPAQTAILEEIVVTAQKRSERLLDVPMSLTAISGDQLTRSQSNRLEDFVGTVPGLTLVSYGSEGSQLVIRGITSGSLAVNGAVANYIDETPYTVEGPFAAPQASAPNLDTFDMQRIEVLRGPQGTLYGANALAGILKYVTNAPDPSGFKSTVEAGTSAVENGHAGFDVHSMVNLPISGDTALRLVGYDNYYPGFIDDPSRGVRDSNGSHFTGGRASLLFEPTGDFSIRFSALYQNRSYGDFGTEDVNPGTLTPIYGNLIQENLIAQSGHEVTQLYNVTLDWNFGFARLLSTTSYHGFETHTAIDDSKNLGAVITSIFGAPYGLNYDYDISVHAITQEMRLASPADNALQWQLGAYFTNESANEFEPFYPIDVTTKQVLYNFPTPLGIFNVPTHYREYAGFADLDYHFTPTFDVAVGGRYSTNDQTFHETGIGIFAGSNGVDFGTSSSQGVFTYSGDIRWHLTQQSMLYARVAEGFVPGGPNDVLPTIGSLPHSYSSSTTTNYEAGFKTSLLDNRLTVDVSAFDVLWHKIQLNAVIDGFGTLTNGGTARSYGAEWNFDYVPLSGLRLDFNGAYTDAYLTEATPASVNGRVGDRLPAAPLWGISASADYERPVFGNYSAFGGVNWHFTGNRYADFSAAGPRQLMPSYNIVDLRTGLETQRFSAALYVKNVGNKLAINYVQSETVEGGAGQQSATMYTPRTVGITLTANF